MGQSLLTLFPVLNSLPARSWRQIGGSVFSDGTDLEDFDGFSVRNEENRSKQGSSGYRIASGRRFRDETPRCSRVSLPGGLPAFLRRNLANLDERARADVPASLEWRVNDSGQRKGRRSQMGISWNTFQRSLIGGAILFGLAATGCKTTSSWSPSSLAWWNKDDEVATKTQPQPPSSAFEPSASVASGRGYGTSAGSASTSGAGGYGSPAGAPYAQNSPQSPYGSNYPGGAGGYNAAGPYGSPQTADARGMAPGRYDAVPAGTRSAYGSESFGTTANAGMPPQRSPYGAAPAGGMGVQSSGGPMGGPSSPYSSGGYGASTGTSNPYGSAPSYGPMGGSSMPPGAGTTMPPSMPSGTTVQNPYSASSGMSSAPMGSTGSSMPSYPNTGAPAYSMPSSNPSAPQMPSTTPPVPRAATTQAVPPSVSQYQGAWTPGSTGQAAPAPSAPTYGAPAASDPRMSGATPTGGGSFRVPGASMPTSQPSPYGSYR